MLRVAAPRLIGSLTLSDQLCGCVGVVLTGRVEGTDFRLIKRCLGETQRSFAVKTPPLPEPVLCEYVNIVTEVALSVDPVRAGEGESAQASHSRAGEPRSSVGGML